LTALEEEGDPSVLSPAALSAANNKGASKCMHPKPRNACAAVQLTIMLMSIAFAGWKPGVPQSGSSLSKLTSTEPGGMLALRCVRMVMQRWSFQS
jgi:hypothetical protein